MTSSSHESVKKLAVNRKALFNHHVIERFEAGVQLQGTEVKSLRSGGVNLAGGYARVEEGQLFLFNINISPYKHGNRFNHDPERPRKLLMHRKQILNIGLQVERGGLTLIPLSLYFRKGRVKVELGLCKGKRHSDKRETIKRRTADIEARRAMRR